MPSSDKTRQFPLLIHSKNSQRDKSFRLADRAPMGAGGPRPHDEKMHWLSPVFVAQIKFAEWTCDKKLRQPVFLGLREDKKPSDVVREIAKM